MRIGGIAGGVLLLMVSSIVAADVSPRPLPPPIVLAVEGTNVSIRRFQTKALESAYPNQILQVKDQGFTGRRSQAAIRLSDLSVMHIHEMGRFEIQPLPDPRGQGEFSLFQGLIYLLHRGRAGSHLFRTPTATAATRGTEFTLEVEPGTGRTILTVLEGEADLSNAVGSVTLRTGDQGVALLGQMPTKTSVLDTMNIIQWCLYYPGVLDLAEINLDANEAAAIGDSLAAYRAGDLLQAVAAYPAARAPASDQEKIYVAALLLTVGQVAETEALLNSINANAPEARLARAIRRVIDAVKLRVKPPPAAAGASTGQDALATELLAESYAQQSLHDLEGALASAGRAVERSPQFAFGWARVAELEFSHGRIKPALSALEKSLALAPRNAQALALKGFLIAAQNRMREAIGFFEQAMAIDGGLGHAWLGRGLCRIRMGEADAGREDLQVAAMLEPQRAVLRSYLGKAFSNAGDNRRAENELNIARELDENDPTAWLYSALLLQQENRINEAVRDLEQSQALNENRRVYRSELLLDQDRAVRGANLANVYSDAGLTDVSVREAGRAVNADYANYSAHLFLANSYDQLRDPKQINLRFETAWFTEYLLANLLAPVGAGTLSQTISQQEYSKLFERDRLGVGSRTEYLSHGQWLQDFVQYGIYRNSSYAAEVFYHSDNGHRPNNDLWQLTTVLHLKQQITPQDSVYVRLSYYDSEFGDVSQYYDQDQANPLVRVREHYEPWVLAGFHHEWSPGSHTLLMAGRLVNIYEVDNPLATTLFLDRGLVGLSTPSISPMRYDQSYESELTLYTAELQHLWQLGNHTAVVGGRFQTGEFDTRNRQIGGLLPSGIMVFGADQDQQVEADLRRHSAYLYDQWQIWPSLLLVGGVSYDWLRFPENHRFAPISSGEETRDQISPKAGLIWTPTDSTTLRGAYFRALGGVSLDQSIRLEPSQVAGFNQAYRSLIPESVASANAAPEFESWAVSVEQKINARTFIGISAEDLSSQVDRTVGYIERCTSFMGIDCPPFSVHSMPEQLDFRERSLFVTLNQLLADEWSLGARYRLSYAELEDVYAAIPAEFIRYGGFEPDQTVHARLHQLHLFLAFNHPAGFFGNAGAIWSEQSNYGYNGTQPGDDFWQFNVEAGYRFARRRIEIRVGLLNVLDQDYQLNPLNLTAELPRERTFATSLRFNF